MTETRASRLQSALYASVSICLALGIALPAHACITTTYPDTIAVGEVRTRAGSWRPIRLEASGAMFRLEYTSPASPTGWIAVVGSSTSPGMVEASNSVGWELAPAIAYWFPVDKNGNHVPSRPARKTTWAQAISAAGLPGNFLGQDYTSYESSSQIRYGTTCRFFKDGDLFDVCRQSNFVSKRRADIGLPVVIENKLGTTVYRTTGMTNVTIPSDRFNVPRVRYEVATCSGSHTQGLG